MQRRPLGKTGLEFSLLSFGASSLGQEFRQVDPAEALQSVRAALDVGMNFIDTSPFYGRGMSEVMLGLALRDVPRDSYYLGTKLGRYDKNHFDFSAKRVAESVDVSLHRLGTDYLDVCLCHDIEFVPMQQIVDETLPEMRRQQAAGKIRFVGISGYPMKAFQFVLGQTDLDVVLSYNHYTLQNTSFADLLPLLGERGVGAINAAPFSARLLTGAPLPAWHRATPVVRQTAAAAAALCREAGVDLARLALQFSVAHEGMTTCVVGSANPVRVRQWADWIAEPIDEELLARVQQVLAPIHNWRYREGLPENNEEPVAGDLWFAEG